MTIEKNTINPQTIIAWLHYYYYYMNLKGPSLCILLLFNNQQAEHFWYKVIQNNLNIRNNWESIHLLIKICNNLRFKKD